MFFAPHLTPEPRVPAPPPAPGTPGIDARHPLERAAWLWHPQLALDAPGFCIFRLDFEADGAPLRVQLSADLRFELALDNVLVARGPDSSEPSAWSASTLELHPAAGPHRLEAFVWWLPPATAPAARMSWRGGFALAALDRPPAAFRTGSAPWRVAALEGVALTPPLEGHYHVIGPGFAIDLRRCTPDDWHEPAVVRPPLNNNPYGLVAPGWRIEPADLPAQRHDLLRTWKVRTGGDADHWHHIPARAERTVLLDLEDYVFGYPYIEYSGGSGAELEWLWAESLYHEAPTTKGDRSAIAGKVFHGFGDRFTLGGELRRVRAPWWRAGRYLRLHICTADEPLRLLDLAIERTGYPLVECDTFACSDGATLAPVLGLCRRGLRAAMGETFYDTPYYEQMMYAGDTRLQCLMNYVVSADARLPRRAIDLLAASRDRTGLTAMRHPSNSRQEGATFAMIWVWMLHDYAMWRDDHAFVRAHLPGVRATLDALAAFENGDGLLVRPPGWLFVDWVPEWELGWPPGAREGVSPIVNLLYLITRQKAADLLGLPRPDVGQTAGLAALLQSPTSGRAHTDEHTAILARLADLADAPPLPSGPGVARASVYFSHYLFEAFPETFLPRLADWHGYLARGLLCPPEGPEPTRSDCHAWGSHPLFHVHATLAGIRPDAPGFSRVRITPSPGPLTSITSEIPHPRGRIRVHLEPDYVEVELPADITGVLNWKGRITPLTPGIQKILTTLP